MSLRYITAEVFRGLVRNKTMAVAIILVTAISLTFVGAGLLIHQQITLLKGEWYDLVEVSVFLCPNYSPAPNCVAGEATDAQISELNTVLEKELGGRLAAVTFESKADALLAFEQYDRAGYQGIQLTEDDMQASFRVKLTDPSEFTMVADALAGQPGVEDVIDQRAVFQPLFTVLNKISAMAAGLAAIMLLTATLLVATTIRLSAISREKEIDIMRLVGATDFVVQLPFVLEGVVAAAIGSILAISGLWFVADVLVSDWLQTSVDWIAYIGVSDVATMAPLLSGMAIILAAGSAALALRKQIKAPK